MGVCKIYRMHTPWSRNCRQHGSLRTKNKTLCTPLGVRRQGKTLYLIHLNEVPKSTPYHLRNSLLYLIAVFDTILFLHKPFHFPIPFYFSLLGRVQIPNLPQTRQEERTPHFCRVRSCHQCIYLFFIKAASFYKHQSMK